MVGLFYLLFCWTGSRQLSALSKALFICSNRKRSSTEIQSGSDLTRFLAAPLLREAPFFIPLLFFIIILPRISLLIILFELEITQLYCLPWLMIAKGADRILKSLSMVK